MTISFETRNPVIAQVGYGVQGQQTTKVDVTCERGQPWKENPEGDCLYRAALSGLQPATLYDYTVTLASGEAYAGTFRTPKERAEEIRVVTISDTHAFKGSKVLTEALLRDRPDFVLHTGDLPAGLGYQKEKYQQSWFSPGAEFLRHIPVVYIGGNHDVGPHFDEYFMVAQRKAYSASPDGRHYSFEYGPAHFVMVSSNPWGLMEMNADLSDLPVERKTLAAIDDSVAWLQKDLRSDTARQAKWRIVGMHHPYTDAFSFRRIAGLLESSGVDLMLGGHLHGYQKAVSVDPARAARTVFITQGTGESEQGEMSQGKPDERIFPEFPEVVAFGRTIFHTLDISADRLSFKAFGLQKGEKTVKSLDETLLSRSEPHLVLKRVSLKPIKGTPGRLGLEADVRNDGAGMAGVVLTLRDNGNEVPLNLFGTAGKERVVTLNPGEQRTIRKIIAIESAGKHVISIGDASRTISIPEPRATFSVDGLKVRLGQGERSNTVFATVDVSNPHKTRREGWVDLFVDGRSVDRRPVALQPNEKAELTFSHVFERGGNHRITVGDLAEHEVMVEDTLKGTPRVKDLSGHGNHGILRGSPKITHLEDGAVSVDLTADLGDYIEIPDSPSLRVTEGVSGIVRANLNRLPIEGEMDRNPILSKGPSLGWGANYLLRMLVKKSGGVFTAGICYDTSEYFWEGNGKAPLGQWAQYAMSFSRNAGGANYIDNRVVGETPAISADFTEFRNWEDHPLFIGYARLGNLIKEFKRPRNFAHFTGQVSQVRYYTTALSADEIRAINDKPSLAGPKADSMAVWLNFEEIETEGTHQTDWRRPAYYEPKFRADRELWSFNRLTAESKVPPGTALVASIQVSDNGVSIKDTREFELRDGVQSIDLGGIPPAQYLRIVTRFKSIAGADGVRVPSLRLYRVSATHGDRSTQLTWGTRADWERGSLTGAIGFEPPDRLTTLGNGPSVRN